MPLSRRDFLAGTVAAASAALLPSDARPARRLSAPGAGVGCTLLDLGDECALRESLRGWEAALAAHGGAGRRPALVVPAAMRISRATARRLDGCARAGAMVILESGAGFAAPEGTHFRDHRDGLRAWLALEIDAPVPLWSRRSDARGLPYVHYSWPTPAAVRDFSHVVPVRPAETGDEIIARVAGIPAALRRSLGAGSLVVLGSPLGPALAAGDAEAARWLAAVLDAPAAARGRPTRLPVSV